MYILTRFFIIFYICFFAPMSMAAFRHLDGAVDGAFQAVPSAQHAMAQFLWPQHRRAAENMVRAHREVDFGGPIMDDVMKVPHRRHFKLSMLVTYFQDGHPPLPQTYGGALTSWFFPSTDEFRANTISRDDQASRLNRAQAGEEVKDQASRRLGAIVRIVMDALSTEVLSEDEKSLNILTGRLLEALGEDPNKNVLQDISIEAFAHYEVLLGLQAAHDSLTQLVQSLSEGDARALDERSEISALADDMRAGRATFESMVQHPFCAFHHSPYVSPEWVGLFVASTKETRKYFGHKLEGKKLKALRKRHLAALIARSIHEDRARRQNHMPHSLTLATLMTFLWQTYETGAGLKAFYEGVVGHDLDWDPIHVEARYTKEEMASLRAQIMAAPDQFWTQPADTQRALLNLETASTGYELPDSGMARVGDRTYSDCVGTMIRCAVMDALRTVDGESLVDKLPEGPFQAYFQTYGHEGRMKNEARDAWAVTNNTVPHAKRVQAGGLEPSVENVVLVLQHMMGDKEPVVAAVDSEQAFRAARTRYQAFFGRFSAWLKAVTGQDIVFSMEDDEVRWTDGRRTTGSLNLDVGGEKRGELQVDPGHGQYNQFVQSVFSDAVPGVAPGAHASKAFFPGAPFICCAATAFLTANSRMAPPNTSGPLGRPPKSGRGVPSLANDAGTEERESLEKGVSEEGLSEKDGGHWLSGKGAPGGRTASNFEGMLPSPPRRCFRGLLLFFPVRAS